MKTFKDDAGRTWSLKVNVGTINRVRDMIGVDLLKVFDDVKEEIPLLVRLQTDVELLANVLFCLISPEADAQGVTDAQFGESLGGEAFAAAHEAFFAEMLDFFRGLRRPQIVTAIEKSNSVLTKMMAALERKASEIDEEELIRQALGSSSGNVPES